MLTGTQREWWDMLPKVRNKALSANKAKKVLVPNHISATTHMCVPGSFWILHSTPHFPGLKAVPDFYFPEKEIIYGQTFLCMSLSSSVEVEQVIALAPSGSTLSVPL